MNSNVNTTSRPKRSYIKSGKYTKENILKRKMIKIFDKFKKLYNKEEKNWYKKLANIHKPVKKDNSKFV